MQPHLAQRDPLLQTVLSFFVPFYILYWLHVTARDIEQKYRHPAPSTWLLVAPIVIGVLSFILMIVGLVASIGSSNAGDSSVDGNSAVAGISLLVFVLAICVLAPVSWVLAAIYYWKFGGNVENIVGPDTSRVLILVLFFTVPAAVTYIVQDKLNKLEIQLAYPQPQHAQPSPYAQQQQPPSQWPQGPQA